MGKHRNSIDSLVLARIRSNGPEWVFSPADFADLGSRTAVATALKRYKAEGTIRQLGRGLYESPRHHPRLGVLFPPIEAIAEAIRRRDSVHLQPTGAYAANLLGLSDQVPMRVFLLTDGPQRKIRVGKLEITLKHTTPRNMATAGRVSGSVIQALRWIGRRGIDEHTVQRLRKRLSVDDKRALLADVRHAPIWIAEIMREVAADPVGK